MITKTWASFKDLIFNYVYVWDWGTISAHATEVGGGHQIPGAGVTGACERDSQSRCWELTSDSSAKSVPAGGAGPSL